MFECFVHFFVDIFICFSEVSSSLGMSQNNVFYACIYQHVRGDFSGVSTFFFEIHILSTNLDVSSFCSFYYRNDVDSRYTEYYVYFVILYQWFQSFNQFYSLTWSHVHFPVTGNNFFSSHVTFPLFLYPFQDLILIYRLLLLHLAVLFLPGIPGKLHHR